MRPKDSPYIRDMYLHVRLARTVYSGYPTCLFAGNFYGDEVAEDDKRQIEKRRVGIKRIRIR